ncbi:hypothetical protein BDB01DRAFT_772204 [Pilobolus umbonatus]|nr:hypothetical protein BDB01DRAFT_772204 [Pilobolus umbonatus]
MRAIPLLISLLLLYTPITFSINAPALWNPYCAYLNDRIYCYSGGNSDDVLTNSMYYLPVHLPGSISKDVLSTMWETSIPTGGTNLLTGKVFSQFATSPDRKKMLIQGGSTLKNPIDVPFIIYDVDTNAWTAATDYNQFNIPQATVYGGTAFYSERLDRYVFYGGVTDFSDNRVVMIDLISVPSIKGDYSIQLPFGFNNLATYDITQDKWDIIQNIKDFDNTIFFRSTTSVYSEKLGEAYFFVARVMNTTNTVDDVWHDFTVVYSLHLGDLSWHGNTCTGNIPERREDFTTTLLPDNKTVLLYGGTADYIDALPNFCYLLDLETKIWSECSFTVPATATPQRFYHSAVLVGNHLFVLFGMGKGRLVTSDMTILDVSDKSQIRYVGDYLFSATSENVPPNSSNPPNEEKTPKKDNLGMILGIVFGFLGALLIAGILFFFFRRKKEKEKKEVPESFEWSHDGDVNPNTMGYVNNTPIKYNGYISNTPVEHGSYVTNKPIEISDHSNSYYMPYPLGNPVYTSPSTDRLYYDGTPMQSLNEVTAATDSSNSRFSNSETGIQNIVHKPNS